MTRRFFAVMADTTLSAIVRGNSGDGPDNVISTLQGRRNELHIRTLPGNSVYDGRPTESDRQAVIVKSPSVPLRRITFFLCRLTPPRRFLTGLSSVALLPTPSAAAAAGANGAVRAAISRIFPLIASSWVWAGSAPPALFRLLSPNFWRRNENPPDDYFGGAREFLFYNHPGTNNMEIGLCCSSYYRLREEIVFFGKLKRASRPFLFLKNPLSSFRRDFRFGKQAGYLLI